MFQNGYFLLNAGTGKTELTEEPEESSWTDPLNPPNINERPSGFLVWVISLPITVLLAITIPNCIKRRKDNCFFISWLFFISVLWIGIFTYVMVWIIFKSPSSEKFRIFFISHISSTISIQFHFAFNFINT